MRWQSFVAITMLLCTFAPAQDKFPMTCHPFQAIEVHHPIDATCGLTGDSTTPGLQAQDKTKNNFCAGQQYQDLAAQDLIGKQKSVAMVPGFSNWAGENVPQDRTPLTKLGEGSAVSFTGYVFEAKAADLNGGESVNCNVSKDTASNDIHIALSAMPNLTVACQSFTAEMSPHYRPASWTPENITKIGKTTMVRVSGSLMYDASHKVCGEAGFSPSNDPSRVSGWEIHPVYAFDVCVKQSGGACSQWQALSDWATSASKSHVGTAKAGSHHGAGQAPAGSAPEPPQNQR